MRAVQTLPMRDQKNNVVFLAATNLNKQSPLQ
jgi:hypothetical protein